MSCAGLVLVRTVSPMALADLRACIWPWATELEVTSAVEDVLAPQLEVWRARRYRGQCTLGLSMLMLCCIGVGLMYRFHTQLEMIPIGILFVISTLGGIPIVTQFMRDTSDSRAPWKYLLQHTPASVLGTVWLQDRRVCRILLSGEMDDATHATLVALAPDFHGSVAKLESTARHLTASEYVASAYLAYAR